MKHLANLAWLTFARLAGLSVASAQPILSDGFDAGVADDWTQGLLGEMSVENEQLVLSGAFGPTPSANSADTYAYAYHSIPTSGALADGQTLEARVDLLEANQNDAFAHLQFVWVEGPTTHSYTLYKDQDEIGLIKGWNGADSLAMFFNTNQPIKNQNVTLVLALTREGSDLKISTRVLDKDGGKAVLFDRTVTDTPQSDPVLLSGLPSDKALRVVPDVAGAPWPIVSAPGNALLGMCWVNTDHGSDGPATVRFDNLEVWQHRPPQLTSRKLGKTVELTWPTLNSQFALESASKVDGPWTPLANLSPGIIPGRTNLSLQISARQEFFRLDKELSQECACDPTWYMAKPPPEWGLPPTWTLRDALPIQYYDTETIGAYFLAPLSQLQSLLPPGLSPLPASCPTSPWSSLGAGISDLGVLNVFFYEHHQNESTPPYREAIISVMVDHPAWTNGAPSWYISSIMVTTKEAQWAGVVGWGYPKIIGNVQLQSVATNRFECSESADGELILRLRVSSEEMLSKAPEPVMIVSTKGGYLVRARWVTRGTLFMSSSSGASTIELGENHPVARQLRAIGIGSLPSIGQYRAVHLQGTLYPGTCTPP